MKKYILPLLFSLVSFVAFSQKGISYQAVILDPNPIEAPGVDIAGQPLVNGDVWMKFSIYNGSALQFEEIHKTKTDAYGLVSLLIGSVSPTAFNSVVWDANQKNMQVFASFDQGASYTKVSEQKLVYTPYALFSETAGKLGGTLAITGGGTGATSLADARVNLGIDKVDNTPDAVKPISAAVQAALDLKANSAEVTAALTLKANSADVTAALSAKADTGAIKTYVDNRLASGNFTSTQSSTITITDADATTKGKIQLAGDLGGTAAAPTVPGLALKANVTDVNNALALKADTSYVLAKVAAATIADADASTKGKIQLAGDLGGTAAAPTVPGLALKANVTDVNNALALKANTADVTTAFALKANASEVTTALALKANTADVTTALTLKANATDFTTLTNSLNTNTQSITSIASDFATLNTNVASNTASISSNNTAINSKAPIASPSFTGTVSAPIYASTPQTLTDASTIAWNPSLGLNASVTLGGNRTLSFTATPASGSYGTLVLTQDATGGRTITLPSTTNKVLGSTSSTTIDLSTAANAIDIVNFYYDGTNYYWNIGQGYGQTASSGSTNLASGVTGTLPVANGGTGATTASAARTNLGLVIGTNVQAPLVAGTDYLAPNGSAANLTNFPTFNQNTTGNAATATLATTATSATIAGNITATSNTTLTSLSNLITVGTITSGTWSGTAIAVTSGGTGATNAAAARTNLGLVIGTNVQAPLIAGTDYQAPITLTTTGTGAATFSGTTLNIPTPSSGSSNTHSVGESYGGGVVFYTWDNGAHGLIVSLTDQCCNNSTIGRFSAGTATNTLAYNGSGGASTSNQTAFTTITGGGVGAGKKNTLLIIASQGLGNGNKYAARYANEYSVLSDGVLYDDWYLGSVDEYHLLANNYPQVLANNSFTPLNGPNKDYWTSTEINSTDAFTVYIRTNSTTSNIFNVFPNAKSMFNNGGYGNVRAIRSF